jgi:hypothetical protein
MKDLVRLQESIDANQTSKIIKEIERISKGLISFADFYHLIKRVLDIV